MTTAIYVRVSTLEQAEEGYSIDEQIDKLQKYCEAKDWTVFNIYKDGGFSGSNLKRPAMTNLIHDAKSKKFDTVLVYKLDRISRSQKDTLYLIEDIFTTNNIAFVSLNESFDTSTSFGKAMIGILAVFAQLEREQIKERMTMGKVGRAKSGKPMGWTKVPFGYKYKNDTYEIDPIQAPVVRQIFNEYLSGISITKLIDKLNAEGHIGKERNWSYRTIRQILDNPVFAGYIRFKNELYPGNHKSIITKEIFDQTQKELDIRQKKVYEQNNNPRPFQAKYMLSGLIRCGVCGSTFEIVLRNKRKDGTRKRFYRCISHNSSKHAGTRKRNPNGCTSPNYEMTELENKVISELEKLRIDTSLVNKLSIGDHSSDQAAYEKRIKELDRSLEKIVELFLDNDIPKNILEKRKDKILEEQRALENKLNTEEPILSTDNAIKALNETNQSVFELSYEDQCILVRKLIHQLIIYPGRLKIVWNFAVTK